MSAHHHPAPLTLPLHGLVAHYGHPMPVDAPTVEQAAACEAVRAAQLAVIAAERTLREARAERDRVIVTHRDRLAAYGWRASERTIGTGASGAPLLTHSTLLNVVRYTTTASAPTL